MQGAGKAIVALWGASVGLVSNRAPPCATEFVALAAPASPMASPKKPVLIEAVAIAHDDGIEELAKKVNFPLRKLFVMDGSKGKKFVDIRQARALNTSGVAQHG